MLYSFEPAVYEVDVDVVGDMSHSSADGLVQSPKAKRFKVLVFCWLFVLLVVSDGLNDLWSVDVGVWETEYNKGSGQSIRKVNTLRKLSTHNTEQDVIVLFIAFH